MGANATKTKYKGEQKCDLFKKYPSIITQNNLHNILVHMDYTIFRSVNCIRNMPGGANCADGA